jgi:hypothetical protein
MQDASRRSTRQRYPSAASLHRFAASSVYVSWRSAPARIVEGNTFICGECYPVTFWGIKDGAPARLPDSRFGHGWLPRFAPHGRQAHGQGGGRGSRSEDAWLRLDQDHRIYLRKGTDVEKLRVQMEVRDAYVAELRDKAGDADDVAAAGTSHEQSHTLWYTLALRIARKSLCGRGTGRWATVLLSCGSQLRILSGSP